MSLKVNIIKLKQEGYKQCDIAKMLKCTTSVVSYHCNPEVKKKVLKNKKIRNKKIKKTHPLLKSELTINNKNINWKAGELMCQAEMISFGYEVFTPLSGDSEIDFIAYKDSKFIRVQVKTANANKPYIDIRPRRKAKQWNKIVYSEYKNIDLVMIYDGTNVYSYEFKDYPKGITLRYKIPSNNMIAGISMAKDFIFKNSELVKM